MAHTVDDPVVQKSKSTMVASHTTASTAAEGLRSADRALRLKALKALKNEIIGESSTGAVSGLGCLCVFEEERGPCANRLRRFPLRRAFCCVCACVLTPRPSPPHGCCPRVRAIVVNDRDHRDHNNNNDNQQGASRRSCSCCT